MSSPDEKFVSKLVYEDERCDPLLSATEIRYHLRTHSQLYTTVQYCTVWLNYNGLISATID